MRRWERDSREDIMEKKKKKRKRRGRYRPHDSTCEQDIVILRFDSQVLEYAPLPQPLHVVPVIDQAVSDRIVQLVRG